MKYSGPDIHRVGGSITVTGRASSRRHLFATHHRASPCLDGRRRGLAREEVVSSKITHCNQATLFLELVLSLVSISPPVSV